MPNTAARALEASLKRFYSFDGRAFALKAKRLKSALEPFTSISQIYGVVGIAGIDISPIIIYKKWFIVEFDLDRNALVLLASIC